MIFRSTSVLIFVAAFGIVASRASAAEFKSDKECVIGAKVADRENKTGKIVAVSEGMCQVLLDGTGKKTSYLFWMLHPAGGSALTDDKLVPGVYECVGNGRYTFMDLRITGANTYVWANTKGTFHVEPSRKVVFETGGLVGYNAKLLAGPSVGLNADGGSFYATTCEYNKNLR